jgi:hypothetical protein
MKGKDLIKWIQNNNAENLEILHYGENEDDIYPLREPDIIKYKQGGMLLNTSDGQYTECETNKDLTAALESWCGCSHEQDIQEDYVKVYRKYILI